MTAQFKRQKKAEPVGFNAMGKPISFDRRQNGYDHAKAMGLESHDDRMALVNSMAEQLERDKPYEAMKAGSAYLDLTGVYRMMAVLLTPSEGSTRATA